MYWPAKVVRHAGDKYEVQYDNGDQEIVLDENVTPFNPPFAFGEETHPLQVYSIVCAAVTSPVAALARGLLTSATSWSNS